MRGQFPSPCVDANFAAASQYAANSPGDTVKATRANSNSQFEKNETNILVKSDKINALRKQYDAFLEDDKKRKDRNEYILGRLDEMRSSTALAKLSPKGKTNLFDQHVMPFRNIASHISDPSTMEDNRKYFQTETVQCYPKQIEVSIIREITKNYILIPKVQSFLPSNPLHNSTSENVDTDWKSKYNILDELKLNEKESSSEVFDKKTDFATSNELPEKESSINDNNFNKKVEDIPVLLNSHPIMTEIYTDNVTKDNSPDRKENIKYVNQNKLQKHNDEALYDNEIKVNSNKLIDSEREKQINNDVDVYEKNQDYGKSQELSNMQEKTLEVPSEQIKGDNNINETIIEPKTQEDNFLIRNDIQETQNENEMNISEILEDSSDHVQNENNLIDNQNYESNENNLYNEESAHLEVNELEKEQNEMFYSENPVKNNEYDQTNVNEQPLEYPANNENYTNEQFSYYDESQQQQPYPSEINEHEESTEQYDPNYQQQYAENYENVPQYDNQQYQEQYQVDTSYEHQQEQVISSENYGELQQNNEHYEPLPVEHTDAYQNQDDVYALEDQVAEKQNYESQQYYNEQQEYSTEVPAEQYVQEEYNQMNPEQELINNVQEEYREGNIENQNTALEDNVGEHNVADNTAIETGSSLKAS